MKRKILCMLLALVMVLGLAANVCANPNTEYDVEEEEPNGTFATAMPIKLGQTYCGRAQLNSDADLFRLTLEEETVIRLSAFAADAPVDPAQLNPVEIALFDADGSILTKAVNIGTSNEGYFQQYLIFPMTLGAGDYFVGICVTGKLNGQQQVEQDYYFEINKGEYLCNGYHRAFHGHVTTPATCVSEGEKLMTCPCGATEIKVLPTDPDAHTWQTEILVPNTCTTEGLAHHTCTSCGVEMDEVLPADHVNIIRQVIQEPTAEDYGIYTKTCADCGELLSDEGPINPLAHGFIDVEEGGFYDVPVAWAVYKEITNGSDSFRFNPEGECLRAQVVTFLWRAAGCPEPAVTENPFVDVEPGSFYEKAVLWAVEKGITTGTDETHFSPNMPCNRATVVTFLYRAFEEPAVEGAENPFTDVPADSWYTAPVLWAVEMGITNGLSADSFGPNTACNRAQIVTFLYRAYTE